jgi:2,3-bisphosphoglycerate-independent phosphoglycerate mutase
LPKGQVGEALALLVTQAAKVLEQHPINSVRMDLEENPANLIWLWGAAAATDTPTFRQRTQLRGAIVSSHFALRGAARLYGMGYAEGPLDWSEAGIQALRQAVAHLVNHHDVVYVHLPIEAKEVIDRACAMDRLDQHLLKPLVEGWKPGEAWRLLWVSDNRMTEAIPFVAYGQGLPQQPIAQVAAEQFLQSPLRLNSADALWHWLVKE